MTAAVRRRLAADVPLGALLSGGIDSAVVVALMAQASAEPVRTFTVGFPDDRYDERPYARAVAERYATRENYVAKITAAADELVRDRLLLPADAAAYVKAAQASDRF